MVMTGRILILNGAPRSGKSSLARAIQANVPGNWVNWGVDAFNASLPAALMPGIGLRPGGERADLEADVVRLYGAFFAHMARLARDGFDVVADLGLHFDYASGFDPLRIMARELAGLNRDAILIGIDCDLDTIMARRNADPQNGFYVAGPGIPAPVLRWQEAVHLGKNYVLRLDMAMLTPEQGAACVAEWLGANMIDQEQPT